MSRLVLIKLVISVVDIPSAYVFSAAVSHKCYKVITMIIIIKKIIVCVKSISITLTTKEYYNIIKKLTQTRT